MNMNELLEAALNVHSQVDRGIVLPGEALNKVIELIAGEATKKVSMQPTEPKAIPGFNAPDRREVDEVYGMPSRAVVLVDIAGAVRGAFPLEALMLTNMAKSMTKEDSGHVLFNRRRPVSG